MLSRIRAALINAHAAAAPPYGRLPVLCLVAGVRSGCLGGDVALLGARTAAWLVPEDDDPLRLQRLIRCPTTLSLPDRLAAYRARMPHQLLFEQSAGPSLLAYESNCILFYISS